MDYQKLGFKSGLEIHQQLQGRKLFCNCEAINSKKEPDTEVIRTLRAVAGETGKVDVAAKHEMQKGKYFKYVSNSLDTCLVEYDEQPPNPINEKLLDAVIEIALLLNAKIVDEVQVMRKTVVDGSNTSGFQRSALVAFKGFIETSKGKVSIPTICLEEEAAQKLEETNEYVTYKLDRLGIGLVEIGTDATIKDAEHAKECASILGMILRSTGKVRRGLGTIRQDVNVSIAGHPRIEIKGFQDLRSIPKTIDNEVRRQMKEKGKQEAHVRKAEPDLTTTFLRPMPGAARMYPETDVTPIRITKERIERIRKMLPELLTDRVEGFSARHRISKELAKELLENELFGKLASTLKNIEPVVIANALINIPKDIKKRLGLDPSLLANTDFEEVLSFLNDGKITKEAVIELLVKKIKKERIDLANFEGITEFDLEKEIMQIIKEKPGMNASAYMGLVMAKHRGKVEGRKVMEILKKALESV